MTGIQLQAFLQNADIPLISLEIVEALSHLEDPQEGVGLEINSYHIVWLKDGVLHRDGDRPAVIDSDGTREWFKNGKCHRDGDKPAVISSNGARQWFKNGELHRDGGRPAVRLPDGTREWWTNGNLQLKS